jgi:hypothetical protein
MVKTARNRNIVVDVLIDCLSIGYESTIEISTSKMRNRMATRKNWKENGRCGGTMFEKPHSN